MDPGQDKVIELFSGTLWEAEMLRTMLADAGIECFVRNTSVTSYLYDPIQASGIKVMILESDLSEARAIAEEFARPSRQDPPSTV